MLPPASHKSASDAEVAVLESVSNVVVEHLRRVAKDRARGGAPVLVQVDGPGRTMFLDRLADKLDRHVWAPPGTKPDEQPDQWAAIEFDAWQHQRVAPPWWWLISALDKQLRRRFRAESPWKAFRKRSRDILGRVGKLLGDLMWFFGWVAVVTGGVLLSEGHMLEALGWVAKVGGSIAAIVTLFSSLGNAVRRHLLAESPRGATALLRNSDPMADLRRRYSYLVRSAGTHIIFLIDNLDRCRADYVVETLEGIQTLLRDDDDDTRGDGKLVAFVVAADRAWLCDSYLHVYEEFGKTDAEPGRPFGLNFVDKIFGLELRMPTVPAGTTLPDEDEDPGQTNPFADRRTEREVRDRLRREESAMDPHDRVPAPRLRLRAQAVERLGEIERGHGDGRCPDTDRELSDLLEATNPGPSVTRQLHTAYCVQRTTQFLGGHEVCVEDDAILRLGIWTILTLRWPLLADDLAETPEHLENLRRGAAPDDTEKDLAPAYRLHAARRLADGVGTTPLTADDVSRFTRPIGSHGSDSDQVPMFQVSEYVPSPLPLG